MQVVAQDTSGKLSRLVIEVPAWPGGLFSSGVYVLDSPIGLDLAAIETACGVNAVSNNGFGLDGDIVSFTLTEYQSESAPVRYELLGRVSNADSEQSEIQFDFGGSTGYSSGIGSWYSDNTLTMRFISDSVVSIDTYYECGSVDGENKIAAFTYSSEEITAVLTADD